MHPELEAPRRRAARSAPARRGWRLALRRAWRGALCAALVLVALLMQQLQAVQRTASAGQRGLGQAEAHLRAGELAAAQRAAARARGRFGMVGSRVRVLRQVLAPVPLSGPLDEQLRAVEVLAGSGARASEAALSVLAVQARLSARDDAARAGEPARRGAARAHGPLADLRRLRTTVAAARTTLAGAAAQVDGLRDAALVAPLDGAARDARRRLARARAQAAAGERALAALATAIGADGPRRYLVLSQNPDEPRPTGGFIGTYGVLGARAGRVRLERYGAIESWYRARPRAALPADEAPPAIAMTVPPSPQTLANVNATPDWPQAARRATRIWRRGGERPIDGVLSFTPQLVARVLRVIGPVRLRGRRTPVTAGNVVAVLDFHAHHSKRARGVGRKRLIARLAAQIMRRLASGSVRWATLARALATGLDRREGLAWSRDDAVRRVLAEHRWDGALPRWRGDFFHDAEFAYPTKGGRGITRRFVHDVVLRGDGSAQITTTITITSASERWPLRTWLAVYGPAGAVLSARSDPAYAPERPVAGHPAAGWLRFAPPGGTTTLRVAWDVPRLLTRRRDGALVYRLLWRRIAAHEGDELALRVTPPPGWRWAGAAPPAASRLRRDLRGAWALIR